MTFVTLSMAAALLTVGQQPSQGPTKIAVVSVPAISERYQRTRDLEAQFEQKRVKLNQERDALKDRIERAGRSLQEEFKPGTQEFEDRRKELAMLEAELQWFVESESQKIEAGLAASLQSIYLDIQAAVHEVAQEHMIDVVLAADRLPADTPASTTQVRQQIVLQKVVYWSPRVDLTDVVVARLNASYKANGSGTGVGRPPSPEEVEVPPDR
jgi:Skp family chaperone for outer membrane proteins